MKKDYYKILGITDEEKKLQGDEFEKVLKKKYRAMALKLHPDKQQGKSDTEKKEAEDKFKEASEAYDTLLNKREEYDNPASNFEFNMGGPNFGGMGMDDILRHFGFGGMDFGFGNSNRGQQQRKGGNIRINMNFTLKDMYEGVTKKIKYNKFDICDKCGGSGKTSKTKEKVCKTCGGSGYVFSQNGFMSMQRTCPTCGGVGKHIENPCPHCGGHGIVQKRVTEEIKIDKGAIDGMHLVMSGKGNMPPHGNGVCGDLIISIHGVNDDKFEAIGNDLYFPINLNVVDAMLGSSLSIDTVDGKKLEAKIPIGTNDGHKLRFRGYGIPKYGTNQSGDIIGVVKINMPKTINEKERKILTQLKEQEHFK